MCIVGSCTDASGGGGHVATVCKVRLKHCLRVGFEVITDKNTRCRSSEMRRRVFGSGISEERVASTCSE